MRFLFDDVPSSGSTDWMGPISLNFLEIGCFGFWVSKR